MIVEHLFAPSVRLNTSSKRCSDFGATKGSTLLVTVPANTSSAIKYTGGYHVQPLRY